MTDLLSDRHHDRDCRNNDSLLFFFLLLVILFCSGDIFGGFGKRC